MKSYKATYRNGHFFDEETNKRILPIEGSSFHITGSDNSFKDFDSLNFAGTPQNSEDKEKELLKQYPAEEHQIAKIRRSGHLLEFCINLSKRKEEDKTVRQKYTFECVLLEDLYMHTSDGYNWRLCPCICELTDNIQSPFDNTLAKDEAIQGYSLNNLFSNVVAFYFPRQRSGSVNAFTNFYAKTPAIPSALSEQLKTPDKQPAPLGYLRQAHQKMLEIELAKGFAVISSEGEEMLLTEYQKAMKLDDLRLKWHINWLPEFEDIEYLEDEEGNTYFSCIKEEGEGEEE